MEGRAIRRKLARDCTDCLWRLHEGEEEGEQRPCFCGNKLFLIGTFFGGRLPCIRNAKVTLALANNNKDVNECVKVEEEEVETGKDEKKGNLRDLSARVKQDNILSLFVPLVTV